LIRFEGLGKKPQIKQAVALTKKFQELVKTRSIDRLEEWFSEAEKLGTKWKNFVKGLRQDIKAVTAALTTDWSNRQVEGQVNRLKFLKRQMYGRAKFDLLRARVLYLGSIAVWQSRLDRAPTTRLLRVNCGKESNKLRRAA
jgi:transposase